jgi:cystathionine beta-lyase/cystathionine gamma-synthase
MRQASSKRTPIYRYAGFPFDSIEQAERAFQDEDNYPQSSSQFIYTRYGNPTVATTEQDLVALEGDQCEWALLTSSGMAAIDIALSVFHKGKETGTWLFFSELYGGTNTYINRVLKGRRAIKVERFEPREKEEKFNIDDFIKLLDEVKPSLLFFETTSNPLLIVANGEKIISAAKEREITVIVDNTFASPYLWHPLQSGADIVVHSATKYLGGHGNITAGVVCGGDNPKIEKEAKIYRKLVGHILSPDDADRLGTQLKTFELRFAKQCENAAKLAKVLEDHVAVKKVRYPGLESHVTYPEARELFGDKGSGAMITFELNGERKACDIFVKNVSDHIAYIPTLGDSESILLHVSTAFGKDKYPSQGMIRLSVGFEPYEELEKSILSALDAVVTDVLVKTRSRVSMVMAEASR